MKKKILSIFLTIITIFSAMPLVALAESETFIETMETETSDQVKEETEKETRDTSTSNTKEVIDIINYEETISAAYDGTRAYYNKLPETVTLVYSDETEKTVEALWYCDGVDTTTNKKIAKFTMDTSMYQLAEDVEASLIMTLNEFTAPPMLLTPVTKASGGAYDGVTGVLSRGGSIVSGDYGTWATQYYDVTIGGTLYHGYCGKASYNPPSMGAHTVHEIPGGTRSSDIVKAILLTNPLTGRYVDPIWSSTFSSKMLWYTHSALSYYWADDETGTGLSQLAKIETIAEYLYNTWIPANRELFDASHAYYLCGSRTPHASDNSGAHCPSGAQDILFATGEYTPPSTGKVTLKKTSANPSMTDNNNCYSLEGAIYGVYSDNGCTTEVGRLTTDAAGNSNEIEVRAGTYYVKEISAPKGYLLDANVYTVNVVASQTATLNVVDMPGNDPLVIQITKSTAHDTVTNIASLAGTQFTIKYYDGFYDTVESLPSVATRTWVIETQEVLHPVTGVKIYQTGLSDTYKVGGDEFYRDFSNVPTLPLGTLAIEETKAAPGYLIEGGYLQPKGSDQKIEGVYLTRIEKINEMVSLIGGNEYTMVDYPIHGGVAIQKLDSQTGFTPQGMGTLDKTKFNIISLNDYDVVVGEKTYSKDEVVATLTTDNKGYAETTKDLLPAGQYKIVEKDAPSGYLISTEERFFEIKDNEVIVKLITETDGISNLIKRGGVSIQKVDLETGKAEAQGGATLEGAVYDIITLNQNPVVVNDKKYNKDEVVLSLTTVQNGAAKTASNTLPVGQYKLLEKSAPAGYLISEGEIEFEITEDGQMVELSGITGPLADQVIRGGVSIQKVDLETGKAKAQGSATLEGAIYDIVSLNEQTVTVEGVSYEMDETVYSLVTDKDGYAETVNDLLPAGQYKLVEKSAPAGYLISEGEIEFEITEDGQIIELSGITGPLADQIIRGDLELVKITSDHKRMAGVEFKIKSKTNGESHIFTTDNNGQYSTAASFVSHKDENGIWFGGGEPDDSKGALPYDTYVIEELRCEANKGMTLIEPFEVIVSRNNFVVHLGTLTDEYIPQISIHTTATNKIDGTKVIMGQGTVTIVDRVSITGLTVGTEYLLKGWQMIKSEGGKLIVTGEPVENDLIFTADKADMIVEIEFVFNASNLGAIDLVTFEELYDNTNPDEPEKVAEHTDIEDKDQTVTVVPPTPDTPKTGDISLFGFQMALISSVFVLLGIFFYKKKMKRSTK